MVQIITNSNGGGGGVGVYKYKGSVQTYEDLPTSGMKIGDTYNVVNAFTKDGKDYPAGTNVAWTGTEWDALGGSIDLSDYQKKLVEGDGIDIDQTTNEISVDTTVIATKQDLATKQDVISDLAAIRQGAAKGATAIQPNDNVSELANDAGYINKDVNDLTNYTKTSSLGAVALSNNYSDLSNKPDLSVYQTTANLVTDLSSADNAHYPSAKAVADAIAASGGGDMLKSVYDPNNINADAFDYDNFINTPTIPTKTSDLNNDSGFITGITGGDVTTALGYTPYNSTNPSGYVTSSIINDTAYASSWNGDTAHSPTKNAVYDKINSMDTAIGTNTSAISTINGKIPSAATTSNKLADKNYVDDSINSVTAYYITKNAQGDQWATRAELFAATTFYSGGAVRVPTKNDYTIVLDDENHDHATTRYIYNSGWEYQYTVNETAMTQAQLDALNSGITAAKVTQYDGYATSKQDVLTAGTGIDITSNTLSITSNFGKSTTAAATAQKEVSIPGIKTLNIGQVIHVLPSATNSVANSTIKLNNFTAHPMRYNNAAITTSTDSIVRPANIVTSFVFDGTYWQFIGHGLDSNTTYSNMSATEANTGTATSARSISASVLKGAVKTHAPVQSVNGQTGDVEIGGGGFDNISNCKYMNGLLKSFTADGVNYTLTYQSGKVKTINDGTDTRTVNYVNGLLTGVTKN